MSKPFFSQAAENNKDHILAELQKVLRPNDLVLEIASGTGQHVDHFSNAMPDIVWQPSDHDLNEYGLKTTLAGFSRPNLLKPVIIDINHWPHMSAKFNAIYSANCIHIIDWPTVKNYIHHSAKSLKQNGKLIFYGPFKYGGAFTTQSNEDFDIFLRSKFSGGGIRDFESLDTLAQDNGLMFESDINMPANNQLLVWRKD